MPNQPSTIRDLRESKSLSQKAVRTAAGLTYSKYVRIEEGSGKTTPEEVAHVMSVLQKMEPGSRKLAGRPFKDPAKQAAVEAARAAGESVAAVISANRSATPAKPKAEPKAETPAKTTPAKKPAPKPRKAAGDMAAALKKPRVRKPKTA